MKRALGKSGAVVVMGIVLVLNQACSAKSLKSEVGGERASADVGTMLPPLPGENSSGDTTLPTLSGESSNSELSGFSHHPSEERLVQGEYSGALTPSGVDPPQRAELTKEEKAAVEAGLQDVFFDYDRWTLSEAGMDALNSDAAYLNTHPSAVLNIEGHCDARGTAAYNMVLGDKRAKAARNYLADVLVKLRQLAIVSYGKERPFCLDADESCYEQNRRDHMLLTIK